MKEKLEELLSAVKPNRREMLKKILLGTGALALAAPLSSVVTAQEGPAGKAKGKKGKGKGRKSKGKNGKGKRPVNGTGKGKGRR